MRMVQTAMQGKSTGGLCFCGGDLFVLVLRGDRWCWPLHCLLQAIWGIASSAPHILYIPVIVMAGIIALGSFGIVRMAQRDASNAQ